MDFNSNVQIKALDRYLKPIDVWAIAFGCMVGWGVFAMPGNTFLPLAGPAGTLISMLISMVIMLIIGRNFSYLMGRTPMTGGVYTYTKEAFGRDHAFISSWFLCLSYLTIVFLNGTALFMVVRILLGETVQKGIHYTIAGNTIYLTETIASVLVLVIVGILFVLAKALLQKLMTVFAVVLIAGVVITAIFCLPHAVATGSLTSFGSSGVNPGYAVFSILILAPWAFVGFEVISFETAHFAFPVHKSRRIVIVGIVLATFAYISMALISVASVPDGYANWQSYIQDLHNLGGMESVPTFYAARSIMGTAGLVVMILTAIASIMTGIIGGYRAATRVLSTMAEDRILSEKFSKTTFSIVFIMAVAIILSLFGRNTLSWFVDLTSFGAIVAFGYTSAAALKIAKTEKNTSILWTGVIGTLISLVFVIVQLVPRLSAMEAMGSEALLLLSLWCLLGFVFYWRTVTKSTLTEFSGMSTSGIVLFSLLVYSAIMWLAKRMMNDSSMESMKSSLTWGGIVLLVIIFVGLAIMLYIQKVVRIKHEASEREKIHAVESSLAKSQFLFNMSHDIRTPMNAIIGYTGLALKEETSETVHDYLEKIDGASQHLLALINDILEMSRIESGRIELEYVPCDLCAIFNGMHDLFKEQMTEKGLDFQIYTGQVSDRYVWCDRKNLNRVLLNILSNAYKFTPEDGKVTASLWESKIEDTGYANYEIRVQDTGIGMSREFVNKMFNAFEREHTSTVSGIEGTGLGLAITKSIVDLMGGTIEVITAPGSGTEVIIRLKLQLADEKDVILRNEEQIASGQTDQEIDFSTKRLLVVEDNPINLEIAMMILQQAGFMLESAENGKTAYDMVAASEPGYYDAVLMDIQMPVMDGYEATRAIRALPDQRLSAIPILAMTANAFKEDEEAAKEAGMQAHIAKPIDVKNLMATLTKVLLDAENRKGND
ncbi:MAG: amino acid permease [Firmicutes bacterium]|nr:amino acid permease [Bacillota bacterium]